MTRTAFIAGAVLLLSAATLAQKNGPSGTQASDHPSGASNVTPALPHDRHDGMIISADPYTDAGRVKDKFGKSNPLAVGILPLEVSIQNETSEPIRIDMNTIQLEVYVANSGRQDIAALGVAEVADLIVHPKGATAPTTRRFPIGIPVSSADKKVQKVADDLEPFALNVSIVPPMGMVHGFLFFNMSRDMALVKTSSLYVPDLIAMRSSKPLLFFEIPLGPDAPVQ